MRLSQESRIGFTLLQLIVVIAIIVILMAVMLPALSSVRSTARAAKCAANLHQIGIGCTSYASGSNDLLPNNSYTLGDDPTMLSPAPPAGTMGASTAINRGTFSTSNYEWFDALARDQGWTGKRTVAARYGAGEQSLFRQKMKYLWCPDIDSSALDPGVWATSYGISRNVSTMCNIQESLPTSGEGPYDFLAYGKVDGRMDCVCMTETCFYNFDSDAYDLTNASIGNVISNNNAKIPGKIHHNGINYLFFDGHVSLLRQPPHSMGGELGSFTTLDGFSYSITSAQNNQFKASLVPTK